MVVKTEWACIIIPDLDFEIPSKSQEGSKLHFFFVNLNVKGRP